LNAVRLTYGVSTALLAGILALHLLPLQPAISYTLIFVLTSALYCGTAALVLTREIPFRGVLVLAAAALLVRASFVMTTPIGSDDVYRYMWDGRVQAAGINPYLYAPAAPELQSLHTSLLPRAVNHPDMKTIYFPLAQWVFYGCYQASGEAIWGIKTLLLLAEAGLLAVLLLMARRLSLPPRLILLYALCPLPIMEFAVDAHLDGIGLPLFLSGLLLLRQKRIPAGSALLGLAMSIKPAPLIVLPALFLMVRGWRHKVTVIAIPAAILALQFVPYVGTSRPLEGLSVFTQHWTFNGIIFEMINAVFQDNQRARMVCAVLLACVVAAVAISRRDFFVRVYLSIFFLLLLSPVAHPWYVTWLAVLLPLVPRWSGLVYASTVSLTSFTLLTYKLTGEWVQYPLVLALEYLPVAVLLALELRRGDREALPGAGGRPGHWHVQRGRSGLTTRRTR
jgi:hypothetical protein